MRRVTSTRAVAPDMGDPLHVNNRGYITPRRYAKTWLMIGSPSGEEGDEGKA